MMNPLLKTDAYKLFHRQMYPKGTTLVYSNWTPRSARHHRGTSEGVVVMGVQRLVKKLMEEFDYGFFRRDKTEVLDEYAKYIRDFTGDQDYTIDHIAYLWDLGYLPLVIKALPEGTFCSIGVPCVTVYNTDPKCYWLTNYLETLFSAELWGPMTSATIAREYKDILMAVAEVTGTPMEFVMWQGHDFSMRGMYGDYASQLSGIGHLSSFTGTDTIPAYVDAIKYYNASGLVAGSVPASEHSVQCAHYNEVSGNELDYLDHLLALHPTGIISIVCDGFDFWKFLTETLPQRKEQILARDGRVVIRPDSGNPDEIICGIDFEKRKDDFVHEWPEHIRKGAMEVLWDIFGGTMVETYWGTYKHLDTHIGLIYGDRITLTMADTICKRLEAKDFSTNNLVLGIGSYTYQFNTRDTFGFAMKATYVEINGQPKQIFKDPQTGKEGMQKKSARGLLKVKELDKYVRYELIDQVTWEEEKKGSLRPVFADGVLLVDDTLETIRKRVEESLL